MTKSNIIVTSSVSEAWSLRQVSERDQSIGSKPNKRSRSLLLNYTYLLTETDLRNADE